MRMSRAFPVAAAPYQVRRLRQTFDDLVREVEALKAELRRARPQSQRRPANKKPAVRRVE